MFNVHVKFGLANVKMIGWSPQELWNQTILGFPDNETRQDLFLKLYVDGQRRVKRRVHTHADIRHGTF